MLLRFIVGRFAAGSVAFLVLAGWFAVPASGQEEPASGLLATVKRLTDDRPETRRAAAAELAAAQQLDDPTLFALIAVLTEGEPQAWGKAGRAIGGHSIAAQVVAAALWKKTTDRNPSASGQPIWYEASLALGRIGEGPLPKLVDRLDDPESLVVRSACVAIAEIGPQAKQAVPALIRLLEGDDEIVRHLACHALTGIGPDGRPAVKSLMKLLDHDDLHTQYWSCRALGAIGTPGALPAVAQLLKLARKSPTSVRRNAILALGKIGLDAGPQLLPMLTTALQDKVYHVQVAASDALATIGPPARPTLPALKEAIDRPRFEARVPAAIAIWRISGDEVFVIRVLLEEFQKIDAPWDVANAFAVLGPAGAGAVPGLIKLLEADYAETRLFVVAALAEIGVAAQPALPALKSLLKDENEDVRAAAGQAIEIIQSKVDED